MKSNNTVHSKSRELLGVIIPQETGTGNLSATALQVCYDKAKLEYGWPSKSVQEILSYKSNQERIFYILEDQGLITSSLNDFIQIAEKQGVVKTLKQLGVYATRGARTTKSVTCNPYIWILLAMEMNPKLYAVAVKWLTDRLILNRIEAGDLYKGLAKSVSKFNDADYPRLARALNFVVFNQHKSGIRNTGTETQLRELRDLESNLAFSIDCGFITSFPQLISHLHEIWNRKQVITKVA